MRAEKAMTALLLQAGGVIALVAQRIKPAPLPQGIELPALAVEHISSTELTTLDASAPYGLVRSRIEVTVLAKDYPTQKTLIEEVRKACNYKRGTIAGVSVASIIRDGVGPDLRDDDMKIFSQSIDFLVTHKES